MDLTMSFRLILSFAIFGASSGFSPSSVQNGALYHSLHSPSSNTKSIRKNEYLERNLSRDSFTMLHATKNKILIIYGTSTGCTETVADLIAAEFGSDAEGPVDIDGMEGSLAKKFGDVDALIVGTPTWNTGADTERSGTSWDELYYDEIQDLDIAGKKVAVFGLGDQISYSENYADAAGEMHDVFKDLGCEMMGYTSLEGYEHESSKSVRDNKFCGLLCDMVNQEDLSEGRVKNWVAQLKDEGILDGAASVSSPAPVVDKVATAIPSTATTIPSTVTPSSHDAAEAIAELKKENARLREMLEENSHMLDKVLETQDDRGFTPHHNSKTQRTMWTSHDGRTCYYTDRAPKSP